MRLSYGLLGLLCLSALGCGKKPAPGEEKDKAAQRPVTVTAVAVAKRDVPIYLDGLGTVTAWKTVTVRSQVDGKLEKVLFKEGQAVKRGELLAQVDPRPFQSALHQAEGALARDSALLKNGKLNLERMTTLRKQNLVAQQQVDDQQASVGQYEGASAVDAAQIETARLNLEYARIVAPLDGVTGVRLIDEGNIVHASDPAGIVVITQIDPIAVLFTLPQDDLHRITQSMSDLAKSDPKAGLSVDAYSREGETKLASGQLIVLDNQINQATATLRLKAVFENPARLLWPNQFVKARLLLTVRKDALCIPSQAVQRGPKGTFVYAVSKDDSGAETANPRPIEIERQIGDQTLIAKGLAAGDQVVVEGQNQLRPGAKVSLAKRGGAKS